MTTTPSPELPDLDLNRLEALARAATPGPWEATHQTDDELDHAGYFIEAAGQAISDDCTAPNDKDAQFIAAANPAAVLALIALARRAKPEGEAPQAFPFRHVFDENGLATITSAPAAQHAEGGVQAVHGIRTWQQRLRLSPDFAVPAGDKVCVAMDAEIKALRRALAAQSQGAQAARTLEIERDAARNAVKEYCARIERLESALAAKAEAPAPRVIGGQRWSKEAEMTEGWLAAQQAAAPGALLAILRDVHDTLSSESDSDIDDFESDDEEREGAPVQYAARKVMEVMDMLKAGAPSAPGTPEAPADKHLPGWERGIATVTLTGHQLRQALDFINPDGDDDEDQRDDDLTFGIVQHKDDDGTTKTGLCCWNDDSDGVIPLDEYPRAAQLDGGQEGSESNG